MKLKQLRVDGFRSLVDFQITFGSDLTVVVGENDSGKTSLIDCLKVITQGRPVTGDDFSDGRNQLSIQIETEDFVFNKEYKKDAVRISEGPLIARPSHNCVEIILARLQDSSFDLQADPDRDFLKAKAKIFGLSVKSNSVLEKLKSNLIDKLTGSEDLAIEGASFPKFNSIQLDGKHFENVPAFFKEVFLREKQAAIWREHVAEGLSIEDFVKNTLQKHSDLISLEIEDRGIMEKVRLFLPDITEIKVEAIFHARDLNVDARVKFLEHGKEISIENKGDGTKRRMTMALLELKNQQTRTSIDEQTIYLLDEPDTHLHVRAQLDLVKTVGGFSSDGNQVILTTHSPFILNAAKPAEVRLLVNNRGVTTSRSLSADPALASKVPRALGLENTHLFFSRTIIIVEGETEERFLAAHYLKRTARTLASSLIKIIKVDGIQNVVGFARAILELHDRERIFILCDNDASPELQGIITALDVPQQHRFQVGTREFEDAFHARVIWRIWVEYHKDCGREPPVNWTEASIESLKAKCVADGEKFSKKLRALNQGGKSMGKPVFGTALGERVEVDELPTQLGKLLEALEVT